MDTIDDLIIQEEKKRIDLEIEILFNLIKLFQW